MSASSAKLSPEEKACSDQHIIIVGAGPFGLMFALWLVTHGVDSKNILVIDYRAGNYSRDIPLNTEVLDPIKDYLSTCSIHFPNSAIMTVEKTLFKEAEQRKISFLNKKFVRFIPNKSIVITDEKGKEEEVIKCDFVFGGTGTKRHIVHAANDFDKSKLPKFQVTSLGDIPNKHFMRLPIKLSKDAKIEKSKASFSPYHKKDGVELKFAELKELASLGWHSLIMPYYIIANQFFYSHAPKKLNYQEASKLALFLVKHCVGVDASIPAPENPEGFSCFEVNPMIVEPASFEGDDHLSSIIPIGNELFDVPFYNADGTTRGVSILNKLAKYLTIAQGKVSKINHNAYHADVKRYTSELHSMVYNNGEEYNSRSDRAAKKLLNLYHISCNRFTWIVDTNISWDEENRWSEWTIDDCAYSRWIACTKPHVVSTGFNLTLPDFEQTAETIQDDLIVIVLYKINSHEALSTLFKLIQCYELFADHLFKIKDNNLKADKYYKLALQLLTDYFPDSEHTLKLKLICNLIIINYDNQNYLLLLDLYKQAYELLPKMWTNREKIIYRHFFILLHVTKLILNKGAEQLVVLAYLNELQRLADLYHALPTRVAPEIAKEKLAFKLKEILKYRNTYKTADAKHKIAAASPSSASSSASVVALSMFQQTSIKPPAPDDSCPSGKPACLAPH